METELSEVSQAVIGGAASGGMAAAFARFIWGDVKRVEKAQKKINDDILQRLEILTAAMNTHELAAAQKWATRTELEGLRNHIDAQFNDLRNFFLQLIKEMR